MDPVAPSAGIAETPAAPPADDAILDDLFRQLRQTVEKARPTEDLTALDDAYAFAKRLHRGQKRKSGEPYLSHPIAVAQILADMQMDQVCLVTGLLHDIVEDTSTTVEEIRARFGDEVARCVDGVTKLSKVHINTKAERQAESIRKMLLAMVTDLRVILVKLADRLHNLRTLRALKPERQAAIAQETVDIYAPIANRLGMGKIRAELEDLAFPYIDPDAADLLSREIDSKRTQNEKYLQEIQGDIEEKLARENVPARVMTRVKRAYSVYQKLKRQKIPLDQVYDLLGVRIVTDSVKNCYSALGVIHSEWTPIPGRIKDFIAIPRQNLYQSLHTSVIGPGGVAIEVQIRTDDMQRLAEEGIAAHWKYKVGKHSPAQDDQRIAWLRQLVEWEREMSDSGDFMSTLKVDLYQQEVYTFTPQGKVIVLPRDATPVDFAYAVHTTVGNECVGAKVNGRIVPLRHRLKNGDVVEILRQTGHVPTKDWLALAKTSRARNKIKHFINGIERNKAVELGERFLAGEARRNGLKYSREAIEGVKAKFDVESVEDICALVGYGRVSGREVLSAAYPEVTFKPGGAQAEEKAAAHEAPAREEDPGVVKVKGKDGLLTYRAKCCNPIRGEAIVGYFTLNKGVAVHSANCPQVQALMFDAERKVEVEWERADDDWFVIQIRIFTDDRPGMLQALTTVLFHEGCNIRTLEAQPDHQRQGEGAVVNTSVEVRDKKQLERLQSGLRRIPGVRDVERVS